MITDESGYTSGFETTPAHQTHLVGNVDTLAAAFQDGFTNGNGVWIETPEHHREMFREGVRSLLAAYPSPLAKMMGSK